MKKIEVIAWQIKSPWNLNVFKDDFSDELMVHGMSERGPLMYDHFENKLDNAIEGGILDPMYNYTEKIMQLTEEQITWLKRIKLTVGKGITLKLKEV